MKILHLVGGELSGGAAQGALGLHRGLVKLGVESKILTDSGTTDGTESICSVTSNRRDHAWRALRRMADSAPQRLYRKRLQRIFSTGWVGYDFRSHAAYKEASLVHLHWVGGGFVNVAHVAKIDKPIVWTLRDMWPMTGGCHYSLDCEQYKLGCGQCPQLSSRSALDLSKLVAWRKHRLAPRRAVYVGISDWISAEAKSSFILRGGDIRTIPNAIDTSVFNPIDKATARSILGLDTARKLVLVGAQSLDHFYKGLGSLREAILGLDRTRYHLCTFGHGDREAVAAPGFEITSFGFVGDPVALRLIYSAADVFVAPSHMEAFGKTLAESMACKTPVVCFDIGGPKDIVDHLQNGYRARPFESADLAAGVEWVCGHPDPDSIGTRAREKIVRSFDSALIAAKYISLYEELLAQPSGARFVQ